MELPLGYVLSRQSSQLLILTDSGKTVFHCTTHQFSDTQVVYPVAVMSSDPAHRTALPDLKLQILEHLLHQHRAILLSAGNESTGGRFSWQTQLQYLISHGYNAYQLTGTQISRFDDKALQAALAKPWTERLPLVMVSRHELQLNEDYDIPVDLVHSLDELDARAALEG